MSISVGLDESRYDRQERISWWDQELLSAAKVLVVGAGALGNEVVKNLALIGVGSVVVVDFDTIESSNLARCIFFRETDEGQLKAPTLAARAAELNTSISVTGLARDIRSFGTGIGRRADVIVGALDSREARLFVNRIAWRVGRPWVDGAIEALGGVARVFSPPKSCYECTLSETDFAILSHRQSCRLLSREDLVQGKVPTTATTASLVAAIEAQEVVKVLHQGRSGVIPLPGAIVFDGANNDAYPLTYPNKDDCLAHDVFDDAIEWVPPRAATFADVVRAAGWDEGIVELGDDHIVGWSCAHCQSRAPAAAPVALVRFGEGTCPMCGEPRQPEPLSSVHVPGERADVPLERVGVREDEILAVRSEFQYRYVWLRASQPTDLPESWW